ncbi:MAG: ABC transporter permease [Gemella sp.]|nr:ABC transporter permease [Gemella sp.]
MTSSITNKLALQNLKNNKKTIVPYIISSVIIIALFYILTSLANNPDVTSNIREGAKIAQVLVSGQVVVATFLAIFTMSTYTFLLKQRSKEMGLYSVLGINKFNILKILSLETIYIALITVGSGILTGILFDKLFYLIYVKLLGGEIKLGFHISSFAILLNIAILALIYLIILLFIAVKIKKLSVIGLLQDSSSAEKEPKARILMVLVALALIGYGYYTSLRIVSPIEAMTDFFYAVLAVIVGTYFLFTSVIIALLKLLKNNKSVYYKTKNFISISNLLFRMKRNAVSLANIAVLSSMILVTVGATSTLYFGTKDRIDTLAARDIVVQIGGNDKFTEIYKTKAEEILKENNIETQDRWGYKFARMMAEVTQDGVKFHEAGPDIENIEDFNTTYLIDLEQYNKMTEENRSLNDGEIFFKTDKKNVVKKSSFKLDETIYKIKDSDQDINTSWSEGVTTGETDNSYIVVKDIAELNRIVDIYQNKAKDRATIENFGFNLKDKSKEAFVAEKFNKIAEDIFRPDSVDAPWSDGIGFMTNVVAKNEIKSFMTAMYGSFLFIGLIISTIFLVMQVVIMYYKQLAEGNEDRDKFQTMQRLGLEKKEIKASISSQILLVFFLPLVVALTHTLFASPMIEKILKLLSFGKNEIFVNTMLLTVAVFALGYFIIYKLTSRLYYNIVRER